jgi:DNA-binding LacI/PurR family transcriptional regulator/signal transduction histidine kinase
VAQRPTIGVLVDWLEDVYQNAVLSGILAAARESDVNVICFAGGVLGSPDTFGARRNGVYDLASPQTVDGLVVLSGTMGNHVGPEALARFCARYRGLPLSSIGVPLPDIASFLVDNGGGMEAAMRHLIGVHGYRRIAFVRGPEVNEEAERRFGVYREMLAAHGLPFDPDLIAPGNFQAQAGADAVRLLIDERGRGFDALVAANDHMALGAIEVLRARGRRIPADVAVVGFDDVEDARFAPVPLATVRQPLRAQGRLAAESVIRRVRGGGTDFGAVLSAEFVPRLSCGCDASRSHHLGTTAGSAGPSHTGTLVDAFVSDAAAGESSAFLPAVALNLEHALQQGEDIQSWHGTLSAVRTEAIGRLEAAAAERAAHLLDEARVLVSVFAERTQAEQRLEAERWVRILRRTAEAIITAFDSASLANALLSELPRLGIPSCYVSVFDEPVATGIDVSTRRARLLVAYDEARGREPLLRARLYPAAQLVPDDLIPAHRRHTFVVEPLFFDDLHLGFVTIEMGPRSGVVYEALRSQLATALKGALLVSQVMEDARRREIAERNTRQAQKLESVGRLAAGIAHEINTPVQFVNDSVHFIRDAFGDLSSIIGRYQKLREALARDPIWHSDAQALAQAEEAADLSYLVENTPPAIDRSIDGLDRVASIVRSMKEFAHPDRREQARADVNRAIENTLVIARNEYKYVAELKADLGELPPVVCHLGELNQVVLNLVINAAHAIAEVVRDSGQKGLITLRTWREGDDALIAVSDTGCGIPEAIRDRIFDPFFTTKEVGRGTGQGLAIARNAIVVKHGGTLTFETETGKGTTFLIRVPIAGMTASGTAVAV